MFKEQFHIEESRLKWIAQQTPLIYSECTTVHSTGEVSLPEYLENFKRVHSDHNSLDDAKSTTRRRQRHTSKKTSRPISLTVLGPIHLSKISKSKKRGPTPLHKQLNIIKGSTTHQSIDEIKITLRSVIDNVLCRSKRIAEYKEKLNALKSCLILDLNMNATFPPNKITLCRSEQLSKSKRLNNTISCSVVQPDP